MRFHELTWPLLRRVDRNATVVLAPIAACEQHGRHLPTFTDTLLVTAVAEGVERRMPDEVLLLPTLWLGASHHHLPFGATLSVPVETHATILTDLLTPLLDDGYVRALVLNGHGGNIDTMRTALRRLQPRYRDRLLTAASYWELAEPEMAGLAEGPRKTVGHACEMETSMVLALRPELVRPDEAADDDFSEDPRLRGLYIAADMAQTTHQGTHGYPTLATAEKGRALLGAAISRTVEVVTALLEHPRPLARAVSADRDV
jgi:creatinine amidohydrolase